MKEESCFLCGKSALVECQDCHQAWFCSQEHLEELHQPPQCFPIKVSQSEEVGRFLVASRDLAPLDLVLSDAAAASGPLHSEDVVCLTCYKKLLEEIAICPDCGLPFCSTTCQENVIHKAQECALFSQRGLHFKIRPQHQQRHPLYKVILILRLLLIRDAQPDKWMKINQLMDHREERWQQDRPTWDMLQVEVVDYLLKNLQLADLFTSAEVEKCIGIVRINGINGTDHVKSHGEGVKFRALFPRMALLSNSCFCNCRCLHRDYGFQKGLEIRSQVAIKAGTELTIQYNSLILGNRRRRELFRKVWFFHCKCPRCRDATEMGSFLNALVCQLCPQQKAKKGTVLPEDPLDYHSVWRCDQGCDFRLSSAQVEDMEEKAAAQLIENNTPKMKTTLVDFYEDLIEQLTPRFHPHHYLLMKVKSNLISQYGNVPNYFYSQLPTSLVERKWRLCQEFLEVFGRVDPGSATDWWAVTQLEAIESRSVLLQRDLESGKIPASVFKTALISECQKSMGDVIRVLEMEQAGTYIHSLSAKAKRLRSEMEEVIRFADFL